VFVKNRGTTEFRSAASGAWHPRCHALKVGTHAINERTCTHINVSIPLERSPLKHITGPILLNNFPVFAHAHNC